MKDKVQVSPKQMDDAYRSVEHARERGMEVKDIISCDILPVSPLFHGDFPYPATKYKLMEEVEPKLDTDSFAWETHLNTHVVADVMSTLRRRPFDDHDSVGSWLRSSINLSMKVSQRVVCTHFARDSYIELSVKDPERFRRSEGIEPGLDIVDMIDDTPVPVNTDKFWASSKNKENLQLLHSDICMTDRSNASDIILSSMIVEGECLPAKYCNGKEIPELTNWVEEADSKVVIHVAWAVRVKKCQRVIVLSNDTDTFTLLLYYTPRLKEMGLLEFWLQYGLDKRMLPVHQAHDILGTPLTKVYIKAYIITGNKGYQHH